MPYGISKEAGGDSALNDLAVERCVQKVMAQGHDKVSAIRMCKASIQRSRTGGERGAGSR